MSLSISQGFAGVNGSRSTRYFLSNDWFIDRNVPLHRSARGNRYEVWAPGRAPGGGAQYIGGASTLRAARDIADRAAGRDRRRPSRSRATRRRLGPQVHL